MDNTQLGPVDPVSQPAAAPRSGRAKRVVTAVAASAVLLGSGAAIGMALTGGAAAATGSTASASASTATGSTASASASSPAGRCAKLVQMLRSHPAIASSHPAQVARLRALCSNPLLRLAAVGGEHGEVTFQGKTGPKTVAFERGTVESVSGSEFTVQAADGTTWTWKLIPSTAMREAGQRVTNPAVSSGELVFVEGLMANGVNEARLIQVRKAS